MLRALAGFRGWEMCYDPDLSAIERIYTRIFGVPINGLRIRLRRVLPRVSGKYGAILDAGCGIGVFSMQLAKLHPEAQVVGVDLEESLVKKATEIARHAKISNCEFQLGDVTNLHLNRKFDLIVSVDNLEHVENDVRALESFRRLLNPQGRLVVHVPGYYRRWPVFKRKVNFDVPGHVRPGYLKEQLAERLNNAGFALIEQCYTFGLLENLSNNISYAITGAEKRNRTLYAMVFPFLAILAYIGGFHRPSWGAGVLAVCRPAGDDNIRS